MTRSLLVMVDRLRELGTRVVLSDQRLLEAAVRPAGGGRVRDLAGQRQGHQAPARTCEDRPVGRGVVGQSRRTADAAFQPCATATDPGVARPDRLAVGSGGDTHCGEAACGEATRERTDQAVRGGLRHLRGLRAAAMKSGSTPHSARYFSYAANDGNENRDNARSLAPSLVRKLPWCCPPCRLTRSIRGRTVRRVRSWRGRWCTRQRR